MVPIKHLLQEVCRLSASLGVAGSGLEGKAFALQSETAGGLIKGRSGADVPPPFRTGVKTFLKDQQ